MTLHMVSNFLILETVMMDSLTWSSLHIYGYFSVGNFPTKFSVTLESVHRD